MDHPRSPTTASRHTQLVSWLWFLAAYLLVITVTVWLAGHIHISTSPHVGWSD